MDHEILNLVNIHETPIQMDQPPIQMDQPPSKTDQTPIQMEQNPIKTDQTGIGVNRERIKLLKDYYGRHYKYVMNLIEQNDINDESISDNFFAELAATKIVSSYVEKDIIKKERVVKILEFMSSRFQSRFDKNELSMTEKDHRYLSQIHPIYSCMLDEKVKKLLEYAIDNDNKIIEKLCAHEVIDGYSVTKEYDIRNMFSIIKKYSKTYVKKCIERYPKSVKYLIDIELRPITRVLGLDKYEIELLEYAIELDGSCIQYHNDPSYELCKKAVRSNPKAILQICHKGKYINNKNANIKTELKTLKNLAIELDPFLIEYPEMRSRDRKIMAESYKRRYWLDKMFDLCVSLHELDLPDEIVYEIYDSLYPNHTLILFELWNVTRIVKKQELRLSKFKEM
jgi:hypothetical protein